MAEKEVGEVAMLQESRVKLLVRIIKQWENESYSIMVIKIDIDFEIVCG